MAYLKHVSSDSHYDEILENFGERTLTTADIIKHCLTSTTFSSAFHIVIFFLILLTIF